VVRRADKLALWGRMAAHYHRLLMTAALSGWAHQVRLSWVSCCLVDAGCPTNNQTQLCQHMVIGSFGTCYQPYQESVYDQISASSCILMLD
jgi:hypothetical protein